MTTKTGSPRRGRRSDPRLDAALMNAAIEVLNESGYAAFTTAAVARRAGASTASLYRRWPSKQALVGAVARHIALEELSGIDTGSLEGDVRELLTRKQRILDASAGPALLSLMGQAGHDADLRKILHDDVYVAARDRLESLITQAVRRQELDEDIDAAQLSVLALVLIGTALARSALIAPAEPRDSTPAGPDAGAGDLADAEVQLFMRALRSERG